MIEDRELTKTFGNAMAKLRSRKFALGCAEFESAFASVQPPTTKMRVWEEILGAYLVCWYGAGKQIEDLAASNARPFLATQATLAVVKIANEHIRGRQLSKNLSHFRERPKRQSWREERLSEPSHMRQA
jgi:hypothetical protein